MNIIKDNKKNLKGIFNKNNINNKIKKKKIYNDKNS
jgi:hypothetical protein